MCRYFAALIFLVSVVGFSESAGAWGAAGHRITAYVANEALTETTRARLRKLLGSQDLSRIANYMDQNIATLEKAFPGSRDWHYNNRPVCELENDFASYCEDGNCATKQIYYW